MALGDRDRCCKNNGSGSNSSETSKTKLISNNSFKSIAIIRLSNR